MLAFEGVGFAYRDQPVLRGIDMSIGAGELPCIVGKNGAGKSTLLRLAAGLLAPTSGRVRCFGRDPAAGDRAQIARKVSFLPQSYRLAFPFSVAEVVLMGRYAHGRRGLLALESNADVDAAREAMDRCDVLDLERRRFDELSGGEQRRVLLAQAFCQKAQLILLDEPTASLDPAHAISVFEALARETRERDATAVVVTHDLNLAARFATRAILIDELTTAADGRPHEVLASDEAARAFEIPMHVGTLPDSDTRFVVPKDRPAP